MSPSDTVPSRSVHAPAARDSKSREEKRHKRIEEGEEETKNNEKPANEDRRGRIGDRKRRRGNFAVIDTSPSLDGERRIRKKPAGEYRASQEFTEHRARNAEHGAHNTKLERDLSLPPTTLRQMRGVSGG